MIGLDAVSVMLGDRRALDSATMRIAPGELVCLLGPNGAGKTTLMRALTGLVPCSGAINLDGRDLAAMSPAERARLVAYLPQGHVAHWPMPVRDVVAVGRMPHGASPSRLRPADAAAVDRALAAVDAVHLADRPVTELSGGERARVMLARALAVEAPLLVADEAVASLDPEHTLAVMELLVSEASRGRMVLASTHDLTLAARYGHRAVVLDRGRIAADGPPADVLTPDLLAAVFRVDAARLVHERQTVIVPWSARS